MKIIHWVLCLLLFWACKDLNENKSETEISKYRLQNPNLELSIVASEPNIIAPIAIDFDIMGRMWVAQMPDYMPDINAEKENIPAGRISILEDSNNDGIFDKQHTFLENIPHLRSIALFNDGILYADNPNLWFVKIEDDIAGEKILIDSLYAIGGNVEHKANGLLRNIDNCFYNAKSNFRYCYENQKWKKEATTYRGQWGITADENGRIYVNDNSNFFFGDYYLPNTVIQNEYLNKIEGLVNDLTKNRRVYPLQSTAINRAYMDGVLDEDDKLINTTSACGPLIFQSDAFGSEYEGDAFICIPEINAIKHLKIDQNQYKVKAEYASQNSEFLASYDEGFRPVNLNVGPDGGLYIVDMHRGMIQHKTYMSRYLEKEILKRQLDTIVNKGRIMKVSNKIKSKTEEKIDWQNEDELINLSSAKNRWQRSKAHELLMFSSSESIDDKLNNELDEGSKLSKIHSAWILDFRGVLDLSKLKNIAQEDSWFIANILKIMSSDKYDDKEDLIKILNNIKSNRDPIVVNHFILSLSKLYKTERKKFQYFLTYILENNDVEVIQTESIISAFPSGSKIPNFYSQFLSEGGNAKINSYHENILGSIKNSIYNPIVFYEGMEKDGRILYNNLCASCHGIGGNGIPNLAPSLIDAQLINSSPTILPLIMKHGIRGEVTINKQVETYPTPMPAFQLSANLSNQDISDISNYIFNAFRDSNIRIGKAAIDSLDVTFEKRKEAWTEKELLELK